MSYRKNEAHDAEETDDGFTFDAGVAPLGVKPGKV